MTTSEPARVFTIPENPMMAYQSQQQPSPANSASPTSPRINDSIQQHAPNPYKQIRPLKSPLYIPAALRPTEHFPKPSPMTPPKSQHGSFDSLQNHETDDTLDTLNTQLDMDLWAGDWEYEEEFGEVTGPPTKEHWKPDEASPSCDSPQCRSSFNLFVRKHHCRHCGHIFCASHAPYTIPLDQFAKFHPSGVQSRACDICHRQYQRWETARSIRRQNSEAIKDEGSESGPPTPLAGPPGHRRIMSGSRGNQPSEQAASSVPKDWHWSTF